MPVEMAIASEGPHITAPHYAFVVLDRLVQNLNLSAASRHHVVLSERDLAALQGFEDSETGPANDPRFLARPVIGIVLDRAFTEAHPEAIGRLRQIAPRIDGTDAIYDASAGVDGILDWQLSRTLGLSGRFLADLSAGHVEAGRLQQIVYEQFEALQEAQRYVEQATTPPPRLGVFLPPSGAVLRPSEVVGLTGVAQNSKREFRAVHAFELHLAEIDRGAHAAVQVGLRAAHSRTRLGTWTLAASDLDAGWNRFDCPFAAQPLDEPVEIEIHWQADAPPPIAIGLGEITMDPRIGCRRSDGTVDERPMAVRIYAGVPGLRLPFHGWGRLADGDAARDRPSRVRIDELLARAAYGGGLPEPRADMLRFVSTEAGLLVHPADRATHVAVIRNVRIDDVRALVADVALAHPDASTTEFGLFAAPAAAAVRLRRPASRRARRRWLGPGGGARTGAGDGSAQDLDGQAAWMRLNAGEQGQVVFEVPGSLGGCFDIYLATREAGEGTRHALAHFLHLTAMRGKRPA